MAFEPGDVVFLKSGGPPMTVAAVEEDRVECLWLGDEGELFRETVPTVTLTVGSAEEDADEADDESEHDDADRADADEDEDDEVKPAKKKRKSA